ncbi:DEKNAAC100534 [Brettanomyces naardenensis]|uniref:Peptidyl-prolyl cis-trans isomerase n=1 Tax=Brettanomyces naardenensis TaxID=13370 RepID=A0A448YED1_BRENA|nr:DEKNAAC100534 [Brettanomyces naardenensis]
MSVLLETNNGNIVIDLFLKESPDECFNFLKLCKLQYYLYSPFFKVQRDFITECGNPGYPNKPEIQNISDIVDRPVHVSGSELKHDHVGLVSFLRNHGSFESRFLITLTDDIEAMKSLDYRASVFGHVTEGFDTLNKINKSLLDDTLRPLKDTRILHIYILEDPYTDPQDPAFAVPTKSPLPSESQIESFRFLLEGTEEGSEDDEDGEKVKELKSSSEALTLELLNDLPSAHIKPSENVLFICKLNPVTKEEDLEILFSRFGRIRSAEVIRDKETGNSLCYGFIEFTDKRSVEKAYLKMDNALIDDRRIHVDFSQSVKRGRRR